MYCIFYVLFHPFNLCVQTSGHKVDGFHATFQGNDFGGLQLTDGCQFHLFTCASSFSRRWSPTPLWQSWRSSWRKAPSSLRKLVSKFRPEGVFVSLQMSTMVIFTLKKPQRDSPVMTRPRNSSTRPGMTLTSPASVSSQWPTILVTPLSTATFLWDFNMIFNRVPCLQAPSWPRPKRTSRRGRSWLSLFSTSKRFSPICFSCLSLNSCNILNPSVFLEAFPDEDHWYSLPQHHRTWSWVEHFCTVTRSWFFQSQQLIIVLFPQCNPKETTFYMSLSRKNGRPVTSTSCLVPLVKHL